MPQQEKTFTPDHKDWGEQVLAYIFARMDSTWRAKGTPVPTLSRFLSALARNQADDLAYLARMYHVSRDGGAWQYLTQELPDAVRTLAHARERVRQEDRSGPRGRIDWSRTLRQRLTKNDPGIFSTLRSRKTYDLPENRLLRKYLSEISSAEHHSKRVSNEEALGTKLTEAVQAAKEVLKTSYLRDIPEQPDASALMVARALRSKRELYGRLGELWLEFEAAVLGGQLEAVRKVLEGGWLAPKSPEDLFELYVLIKTLEAVQRLLEHRGPVKVAYGLVRPGGRAVAKFEGRDISAEVWFDRSPDEAFPDTFNEGTYVYGKLLDLYNGLTGAARRPDILVRIECPDFTMPAVLLVEAKCTLPDSEYGRDSLYKVIGYLSDFASLWNVHQKPKLALAFPKGVIPVHESEWLKEDIVVISDDLGTRLDKILASVMA